MALNVILICYVLFLIAEIVQSQGYYTTTEHPCNYQSYSYVYSSYSIKYKYCSSYSYSYSYCCGSYTYRYCCYDYNNYYSSYVYSYISDTLSAAAIAGIVIGVLFTAAIVISIIVCICCAVRKRQSHGGVVYQNNAQSVAVVHSQAQPGVAYPTQPYIVSPQNYPYPPAQTQPIQPPIGVAAYPPPYQPQGGVTNTAYTADQGSAPNNKASAPPPYETPTQQYETMSSQQRDDNVYTELQ